MILKLVITEQLVAWRLWVCAFVVALFTALIACVCAGDFSTAATLSQGQDPNGLINHAIIFGAFNAPVVIGALNVLLTYIVDLQRARYALWQLAGVGPRTIRSVVLLQAALLGVVAFAIALLMAAPTLNLFLNTLSAPIRTDADPLRRVTLGVFELLIAFVLFMAVIILSAIAAARKASRTPVLAAIRVPEVVNAPLSKARIVLALAFVVLTFVGIVLTQTTGSGFFDWAQLPQLIAFLFAAPWVAERVMRFWVRLVPGSSDSWFVARESAKYNVTRSHAGITLMVVAIGLAVVTGYIGLWADPAYVAIAIAVFGAPIGLVLFAGVATIIMTSGHRRRDTALLAISGGTRAVSLTAAAFESLIFTLTAGIISLVLALPAVVWPQVGGNPVSALAPLPVVLGLGFILMFITTSLPVLQASRDALATELRRVTI
jgi:putative ABC transport system permease protein